MIKLPGLFCLSTLCIAAGAARASSTTTPFDVWASLASARVTSPVAPSSTSQNTSWVAPDGRTISLVVRVPTKATAASTVTVANVPAGQDARPYFDSALQQVRATHARMLVIPKGTYVFSSLEPGNTAHWLIQGLQNVTISGMGSTLVFTQNQFGIYVTQSRRLEINDLSVSYNLHTASLGTVQQQNGQNVLVIDPAYPVTAADTIGHLAEYNPSTQSFVLGGKTLYTPPGSSLVPTYAGNQTYTSPAFQGSTYLNRTFVVFHHWYGGNAIQIEDSPSPLQDEDIVLNGVKVLSGPGVGIGVYGVKRGLGIWNSQVAAAAGSLISTEYDAMHILIAGGDVSLMNNTIANQGDDAINLNGPISPIVSIDSTGRNLVLSTYSRFISAGDALAFFDSSNNFLGTARVTQTPVALGGPSGQYHGIVLSTAIHNLTTSAIVRDVRLIDSRIIVQGNVIKDCQCHGILVQTPNTLVTNNTFSNTVDNPIRLLTNTGNFVEGVGAFNVILSSNTISNAGMDAGISGMPWAAISLYGVNQSYAVSAVPVNKYVEIENNVISGAMQACITTSSSEFVTVSGNTCTSTNQATPSTPGIEVLQGNNLGLQANMRQGTTGPLFINPNNTFAVQAQTNF